MVLVRLKFNYNTVINFVVCVDCQNGIQLTAGKKNK